MVVSRGKRKQKDLAVKLEKPPDPPKRLKFQAQRKFAQGQATSSSASTSTYLTPQAASQQCAPVKENRNPPPELLPDQRPNTEDFLTFLCFRGTPVLPPALDFLNQGIKKHLRSPETILSTEKIGRKTRKAVNKKECTSEIETSFIPGAVRKQALKTPMSNKKYELKQKQNSTSVAALKKKYQQQRIAREQMGDGRRTRSYSGKRWKLIDDTANEELSTKTYTKRTRNTFSKVQSIPEISNKKRVKKALYSEKSSSPTVSSPTKKIKVAKENENLKGKQKNIILTKQPIDQIERRQTRYASFRIPPPLPKVPKVKKEISSKTTFSQVKVETPLVAKKSTIIVPKKPQAIKNILRNDIESKEQPSMLNKKAKAEVDFSSEDDEPLSKAVGKKTPTSDDSTVQNDKPSRRTLNKIQPKKSNFIDEIVKKLDDEIEEGDVHMQKINIVKKPRGRPKRQTKDIPLIDVPVKTIIQKPSSSEQINENPKKRGRKPGSTLKKEAQEMIKKSTFEFSEPEKITRPTRKTKEAATIYMELIGRKLSLKELSDDDSLDSLELPNIQKAQKKIEEEIMANFHNEKKLGKQSLKTNIEEKQAKGRKRKTPITNKLVDSPSKQIITKSEMSHTNQVPKKKLEKSFSESDEEPLLVKAVQIKTPQKTEMTQKNAITPETKSSSPKLSVLWQEQIISNIFPKTSPSKILLEDQIDLLNRTDDSSKVNRSGSKAFLSESPKMIPFSRPKTDFTTVADNIKKDDNNDGGSKLDNDNMQYSNKDTDIQKNVNLASKSTLGNFLLPSKEESQKIFGIASVSLAQSSGPLDTKCTLGKCGSVHKPSLGPAVLTESNLGGHLSPKDRRKSKVNMTHDQIQKWIDEVSLTPLPLDDGEDNLTSSTKTSPYPTKEFIDESSSSQKTSQKPKDEKRPNNDSPKSSTSKVAIKEETQSCNDFKFLQLKQKESPSSSLLRPVPLPQVISSQSSQSTMVRNTPELFSNATSKIVSLVEKSSPLVPPKILATIPPEVPKIILPTAHNSDQCNNEKDVLSYTSNLNARFESTKKDTQLPPKPSTSFVKSSLESNLNVMPSVKAYTVSSLQIEKKPSRTPIYKQETVKPSVLKTVVNTFGAFSPENEKSIYSFEEDGQDINNTQKSVPSGKRKRTKVNDDSSLSRSTTVIPLKPPAQAVSLTLTPDENLKTTEIGLKKTIPSSTEECSEVGPDEHTFYIPLQGANLASADKSGEVIQGVALKLGTEGPEGPNQRVIMHAKLVTKAQMGENSTPIPENIANMQEIVKSLMSSKDGLGKSVPVGTVMPRFKSSDLSTGDVVTSLTTSLPTSATLSTAPVLTSPQRLISSTNLNTSSAPQQRFKHPAKPLIKPSNTSSFPRLDEPAQMVEAPVFKPTEKEFQDPIEFFERILPVASRFGICRIIPPASFKPECRVTDDMRFTAYNQYIHKMLYRWGPSAKELAAIKKYLDTQKISMQHPPWIGGMEVDLPRLYHTVQELGGLKEVIEKKKWPKVSEEMCIPKTAHDRVSKLDDIYCKYLLPYDTLSPSERQKLFDEVEADWAKQEAKARRNADRFRGSEEESNHSSSEDEDSDDDGDGGSMECIVKGRSMPLNQFFRIARNTMALWFKNTEPSTDEIEAEFWRHVAVRDSHVCVHSGSIDSSGYGYGFPSPGPKGKGSACAKHPWNLKVLTNNHGSILRSLGQVTGVTVPTIHVGMLFSACCWYRDPHGLPWVEYLHTGGTKIWYGVPDEQSSNFRNGLINLIPSHCQNKTIWLPCDTAMVPPFILTDKNVSLCRTEQQPGQFVMVMPRAYTSSICTGYTVSESVMFATSSWLDTAKQDYEDMHKSCEPAMFSLEQLLFAIATDQRSNIEVLSQVLPMLLDVFETEKEQRKSLKDAGVEKTEKFPTGKNKQKIVEEYECEICRANLSISMVKCKSQDDDDDRIFCMVHALKHINTDRIQAKNCKLVITYFIDEIETLIGKIQERLAMNKKVSKAGTNASPSNIGSSQNINLSKN